MYIYVGKLTCSGKLDNGKGWSGLRLAAGVTKSGDAVPYVVKVYKVASDPGLHSDVGLLEPGDSFDMAFDEKGRVIRVELCT